MKLEIETETTTAQDINTIKFIFGLCDELEIKQLQQENEKLKEDLGKKDFSKTKIKPITLTECVLYVLDKLEIATIKEICERIDFNNDNDNTSNIYAILYKLKQEKKIKDTIGKPKKYFLVAKGNPELKSMFPKGTKATNF